MYEETRLLDHASLVSIGVRQVSIIIYSPSLESECYYSARENVYLYIVLGHTVLLRCDIETFYLFNRQPKLVL